MKTRINRSAKSLDEIIKMLSEGKFPEGTWVAKNYNKEDLIRDLTRLNKTK